MPTKFTVHKWLCDYCPQVDDAELECHVHERVAHPQQDGDGHVHALEQICARLQQRQQVFLSTRRIDEYERLCKRVLNLVDEVKNGTEPGHAQSEHHRLQKGL
jgi:hypothetical protein